MQYSHKICTEITLLIWEQVVRIRCDRKYSKCTLKRTLKPSCKNSRRIYDSTVHQDGGGRCRVNSRKTAWLFRAPGVLLKCIYWSVFIDVSPLFGLYCAGFHKFHVFVQNLYSSLRVRSLWLLFKSLILILMLQSLNVWKVIVKNNSLYI